ncbi:MAG: TfoX/Sxy family protein, partial [Gammaproteobacteria bacterium]|nr:TfoX/Sxy family protein [Gammaproteobacteria bacterium]
MFALVADDMLYLNSDARSQATCRERELDQYEHGKGAKTVAMSSYLAPEEALDDPEVLHSWAKLAYQSAFRSRR